MTEEADERPPFRVGDWLKRTGIELWKEALAWSRLIFPYRGLWIFVPGIAGMLLVYAAYHNGWAFILDKEKNEALAIVLLSAVVLVMLIRALFFRCRLDFVLLALSVVLLSREIHFAGTHKGVYVAAAVVGIWAFLWRHRLFSELRERGFLKVSIAFMVFTYTLAVLIQRRRLHHVLPLEQELHVELEEVVENIAHLSFLWVACWCFSLKKMVLRQGTREAA